VLDTCVRNFLLSRLYWVGSGWVQFFSTCSGLGWAGSVSWWVGLDQVTQNGLMDNSVRHISRIPWSMCLSVCWVHRWSSPAKKTDRLIEMPFVGRFRRAQETSITWHTWVYTLASPSECDWTIRVCNDTVFWQLNHFDDSYWCIIKTYIDCFEFST